VLELNKGGAVRDVVVTTGIAEGSYIEIKTGLQGGEVVIVEVDAKK
jgi:multidrug efflux pump subunit AcrA (membrane-fusion protein)